MSILETCPLFCGLTLPEGVGRVVAYGKNAPVFAPQEQVNWLGVVVQGRVDLFHLFPDGSRSLLSVAEPGEVVGAELICTKTRIAPYHAETAEATSLLVFPAEMIWDPGILEEPLRVELVQRLLQLVANESMKKTYRLAILSQRGLRARILTYLTMQAQKRQTRSFSIPFSREDLASFLGVNRSALSHALSRMEAEGLIAFQKNQFTLLE